MQMIRYSQYQAKVLQVVALGFVMIALNACTLNRVPAYERGDLAKPEMASNQDSLEAKMRDHVFFRKEG